MTNVAEKLRAELLRLPTEDRAELAYCLIQSLDVDDAKKPMPWEIELERRWQEMECGETLGESAEEVFEGLRNKYP